MTLHEQIESILSFYGHEAQKIQAMQEFAELIVAITKNKQELVIDELADCWIMFYQMQSAYEVSDVTLAAAVCAKVDRQLKRMSNV